jgi:hypothetical protein
MFGEPQRLERQRERERDSVTEREREKEGKRERDRQRQRYIERKRESRGSAAFIKQARRWRKIFFEPQRLVMFGARHHSPDNPVTKQ